MKLIRTLIVIALAVGISYAYMHLKQRQDSLEPDLAEKKPPRFVLNLEEEDEVTELIIRRGKDEIVMRKSEAGWGIVSPAKASAQDFLVDGMVRALRFSKRGRSFRESSELAEFGLSDPAYEVGVRTEQVPELRFLAMGEKGPLGKFYYAKWKGESQVFFISGELYAALDKSLYSLRKKSLLHIEPEQVDLIRITDPKRSFSLELTDKGWIVRKGLRNTVPADPGAIKLYLEQLNGIFAKRFYDGKSWKHSSFGLYPERKHVEVDVKGEGPVILVVGKKVTELDGFFVTVKDKTPVVVVASDIIQDFFKDPDEFEKNTFLTFDDPSKMEIEIGDERISWEKVDGLWRPIIDSDEPGPEFSQNFSPTDLLSFLSNLSYREKMGVDSFDETALLKESLCTVRCFQEDGAITKIIEFLQAGNYGFVKVEGEISTYRISLASLDEILNLTVYLIGVYDSREPQNIEGTS